MNSNWTNKYGVEVLLTHIRGFVPIFLEQFLIMEHGDPYVWRMKWALSKRLDDIDYSWAWFGGTFIRTETTMWNEFVQRSMPWRRASSTKRLLWGYDGVRMRYSSTFSISNEDELRTIQNDIEWPMNKKNGDVDDADDNCYRYSDLFVNLIPR